MSKTYVKLCVGAVVMVAWGRRGVQSGVWIGVNEMAFCVVVLLRSFQLVCQRVPGIKFNLN